MRLPSYALGLLATCALSASPALALRRLSAGDSSGGDDDKLEPCTIRHPTTKEFYDLRGLARSPDEKNAVDWHANGHDYGSGNFTINVCHTLIDTPKSLAKTAGNVSAMYRDEDGEYQSVGQVSTQLKFQGKKLILEYDNGSECPGKTSYKKSSLIVFTCDPLMVGTAAVSFVGQLHDCSYFFEYKTSRACATTSHVESALSPGYVFLIIFLVALAVYMVGGCMYSRAVLHQRGWRQIPHHEKIRAALGFVGDFAVILGVTAWDAVQPLLAKCGLARSRGGGSPGNGGGYERGASGLNGNTSMFGAYRDEDADLEADPDNQLIDNLDDDRW